MTSAADSEESKCPDFATASIRTQSIRSTVAQRSSSAMLGCASPRSASLGGGFGSGTGVRCLTAARLALIDTSEPSLCVVMDGTVRASPRTARALEELVSGLPCPFCFHASGVSTSVPLGTHQGAISHEQLDFYL